MTETVSGSAGAVIPSLQADPATVAYGNTASDAMLHASKVTTGIASIVIALGLTATIALPLVPKPPPRERSPRGEKSVAARRRKA